jgi:hypothetical protein
MNWSGTTTSTYIPMCNKYRFGVNSKKLMDRIPSPVSDCLILDNFPDVTKLDGTPYFEKWDGDTVTESSQPTLHITSLKMCLVRENFWLWPL